MKIKAFILVLTYLFTIGVSNAQKTTLQNPILTGFYPDPSIVKVGADYYSVHSTFSYFPGLPIMHSRDLKNWKQIGNVINRPSQMDFMGERMSRGLFAPAIAYYKGIYYVTCTDIDHDGNFVVTATNPVPYSDPVKLPQVRGIDPPFILTKLPIKPTSFITAKLLIISLFTLVIVRKCMSLITRT
jgi:alpha-N-arabinofuranosidase